MFLLTGLLAASCGGNGTKPDPDGTLELQISLKTDFSCGAGDEIAFNFYNGKGPRTTDVLVLKGSGGEEHVCTISRVGAHDFSFIIPEGLSSGSYTVSIRRGSVSKTLGQVNIAVEQRVNVEKKDGCNVYGIVMCGDKGVPGVVVSDGVEVTTTDGNGVYYIRSGKKYGYVFISIPKGYEVPSEGILPVFYQKLSEKEETYDRKDFTLAKTGSDNYTVYVLGDMHLANRTGDIAQFREYAKDLNGTIAATPGKEYVLTLGDMTWDAYWYDNSYDFSDYVEEMDRNFSGIQFFHTMGNHDNDYLQIGDFAKENPYRRSLGPTFYSFNIGQVHYIVLDDIDYNNVGTGKEHRGEYVLDIISDQMAWLAKDLSHVDRSTPVVLSTHAPVFMPTSATGWRNNLRGADAAGEANTDELLSALDGYTVHFFTGHTHKTFGYDQLSSRNFFEHNGGAVCGDWWWSGNLTPGVLIAQDGAPSGYTIWKVKGKEFSWQYKSAHFPVEHQFRSYDMNEVRKVVTMGLGSNKAGWKKYVDHVNGYGQNDVLINVWNYDAGWEVTVTENGAPLPVTAVWGYDPLHMIAYDAPRFKATDKPSFPTGFWNHFFKVTASTADADLEIRVEDRFGKVYTESMARPKTFSAAEYAWK